MRLCSHFRFFELKTTSPSLKQRQIQGEGQGFAKAPLPSSDLYFFFFFFFYFLSETKTLFQQRDRFLQHSSGYTRFTLLDVFFQCNKATKRNKICLLESKFGPLPPPLWKNFPRSFLMIIFLRSAPAKEGELWGHSYKLRCFSRFIR